MSSPPSRPRLAALGTLANNIHWTWDRAHAGPVLPARSGTVGVERPRSTPPRSPASPPARWAELSADPEIAAFTDAAAASGWLEATTEPRWFQGRDATPR